MTQRDQLIDHILKMKSHWPGCTPQPDYAREALKSYDLLLPDLHLIDGVRAALQAAAEPANSAQDPA